MYWEGMVTGAIFQGVHSWTVVCLQKYFGGDVSVAQSFEEG